MTNPAEQEPAEAQEPVQDSSAGVEPYEIAPPSDDAHDSAEVVEAPPPSGDGYEIGMVERAARPQQPDYAPQLAEQPAPPKPQVSLLGVFLLMTLAAALLAGIRSLPRDMQAGVCGGLAVLGLLLLSVFRPRSNLWHAAWWLLLAIYLLVAILAAVGV